MTCEQVTAQLLAFLDGRLGAAARAAIETHLAACAQCRAEADGQRAVGALLASRPAAAVSASFDARLRERLRAESGWLGVADFRWLAARVVPVAAALLIAAGVVTSRSATSAAADQVSFSQVVESWATGGTARVPAASLLWKEDVSQDSALLAVLAAPADAAYTGQSDER
jgi:anti-sigma factor RsiW